MTDRRGVRMALIDELKKRFGRYVSAARPATTTFAKITKITNAAVVFVVSERRE